MAKTNLLEVKRFGKGKERVTVAVLPGHEFEAKHFDPANLELTYKLSRRVHSFKSRILPNESFICKTWRPSSAISLRAVNEAKLARFANQVAKANGFHDITVEEPLAVHYNSNASPHVFYRSIPDASIETSAMPYQQQLDRVRHFVEKLHEIGIVPRDRQFFWADKRIHIYDVECWQPSAELRKLLKLRREK